MCEASRDDKQSTYVRTPLSITQASGFGRDQASSGSQPSLLRRALPSLPRSGSMPSPAPTAYFMTRTPFLVAASRSTLSTPVPALPTTWSFSAALMTSAVTLVAERTMRPSQS